MAKETDWEKLIQEFGADEVVRMARLGEKLAGIDLDSLRTPAEKHALSIRKAAEIGRAVTRLRKKRPVGRPRKSKREKLKTKRQYYKTYMRPRQIATMVAMWEAGDTWGIVNRSWKPNGYPVEITQDEWMEYVHPSVEGRVFTVNRYATALPLTLDNIFIVDTDTKKVLYDGKEYSLRKMGYCL